MIVQFNDIMRSFNALAGSAPKPVTGCLVDVENGSRLEFCFNPGEIDDDILFNGSKKWLITQAKVRYNNLWTKSLDPLWATVDIELTEWHDDNNFGRRS